jgi:hypothetical protein
MTVGKGKGVGLPPDAKAFDLGTGHYLTQTSWHPLKYYRIDCALVVNTWLSKSQVNSANELNNIVSSLNPVATSINKVMN